MLSATPYGRRNGAYQQPVQIERRFLTDPSFGPVFPNILPAFKKGKQWRFRKRDISVFYNKQPKNIRDA